MGWFLSCKRKIAKLFSGKRESVYAPWLLYYGSAAFPREFDPYNPLIFNADSHPPLKPLQKQNKTLFAFLSLGQIHGGHPSFQKIKDQNLILGESPHAKNNYCIDIRNPLWEKFIIETAIPNLVNRGFNALTLDNLDVSLYLEQTNPTEYPEMKIAAIALVQKIRSSYPTLPLMLNRAYQLLPEIGDFLDIALGSNVYTTFNYNTMKYEYLPKEDYLWQKTLLQKAKAQFPHLQVLSLDYWDPTDHKTIKEIYQEQRRNGFRPYVGNKFLDTITEEP